MFSATFLPSGADWDVAGIVSSVYTGLFNAYSPRTDENILIQQLQPTYPDRDYLCIVDGCYTIEFIHNPSFDISGLSFTVESPTAFVEKSLGDFQTYIDFCVEGTEFNHNPTSSPTISALPTPAPSSSPSSSPSSAPSRSPCQYLFRVFLVEVLRRRGGK